MRVGGNNDCLLEINTLITFLPPPDTGEWCVYSKEYILLILYPAEFVSSRHHTIIDRNVVCNTINTYTKWISR